MPYQAADVRIENLRAGYSSGWIRSERLKLIADGFNLHVPAGSVVALVGGNGAGKSTVLRAIVDPSFRIEGEVFSGDEKLKLGEVGYLPQQSVLTLFPWRTGIDNAALWKEIHGYKLEDRIANARRISREYEIEVPLDRPVYNLSGGERVKIALLRSLAVGGMKAWVLDEPFEGLDLKSRLLLRDLIHKVAGQGIPVLITSHRREDLAAVGAKEYLLEGQPITRANPLENSPHNPGFEFKKDNLATVSGGETRSSEFAEKVFIRERKEFPLGFIGILGGIFLWAIIAWLVQRPSLLPTPFVVWEQIVKIFSEQDAYLPLLYTFLRALGSWCIGVILALPLGILIGYYVWIYRLLAPWLLIARTMPVFALVGISIGLFAGLPELQRIFLISLAIFTIFLQVISAATFIAPRRRVEIARIYGASEWFCLRKVMFYEVMSGILGGLEVTLPLAVIVALVVETFLIPETGLGNLIISKLSDPDTSQLLAYLFPPAIITALSVWLIRRYFRRWRLEL